MAGAIRRQGLSAMTGASLAAARRPEGLALVDERGALTWGELEQRTDALAAALSPHLARGRRGRIGLLARNHRGFVESLVATGKLGADLVLLNTAFSGPQLAELLGREHVDVLIYDQEYAAALADLPGADGGPVHVIAWEDEPAEGLTVDGLVDDHLGQRPPAPTQAARTSCCSPAARPAHPRAPDAAPAAAPATWSRSSSGCRGAPRTPSWSRHRCSTRGGSAAWCSRATMANTVVMRRHFDPEETLAMAARHRAGGMAVVPVMLERIVGAARRR